VELGPLAEGLGAGDSVAVGGACLTVTAVAGGAADFDVVPETLARTTLGELRPAARVNLERALRLGEPVDGHLVQGHVDGLAELRAVRREGGGWSSEFAAPRDLTGQMVPKGSIALDGVSLTLADVADGTFRVALVPTTLAQTTLGELAVGDRVNVELDVLGKYVRQYLLAMGLGREAGGRAGGLTVERLRESGFL